MPKRHTVPSGQGPKFPAQTLEVPASGAQTGPSAAEEVRRGRGPTAAENGAFAVCVEAISVISSTTEVVESQTTHEREVVDELHLFF